MPVLPDADHVWRVKRTDAADEQTSSGTSWAACRELAERAHPGCELLMVEVDGPENFILYARGGA